MTQSESQAISPGSPSSSRSEEKRGDGRQRTELAPLIKRFPTLAESTSATWFAGTLGEDRAPGPTSYWIDAVVVLRQDRVDRLMAEHAPTPATARPPVVGDLASQLPPGPFVTSGSLDEAFASGRWAVSVWLAPKTRHLVLVARGQ